MARHDRKAPGLTRVIWAGAIAGLVLLALILALPSDHPGTPLEALHHPPAHHSTLPSRSPVRLPEPPAKSTSVMHYTVVRGDSLWQIATRFCHHGADWVRLWEGNRITSPGLIHPGQVLRLAC